ncbi:MAG: hypothetical protein ACJ8IR_02205 [Alphaproteobacteria bacterium]
MLKLQALGMAAFLGLAACGGGGGQSGPPKVQPVADVQEANILIPVRAGFGPASWVLLQYDGQNQVYNAFINRNPLPVPSSSAYPDIGAVTSDPNNWDSYAQGTVTFIGTTTALTLDAGRTPNTFTTTSQTLSDFLTGNPNVAQTAWNEIGQK